MSCFSFDIEIFLYFGHISVDYLETEYLILSIRKGSNMFHKDRGVRRKNAVTKAKRKQDIALHVYGFEYYDNLHQYSKNKIHCSCPLCAAKTSKKTIAKQQSGTFFKRDKNYKPSECRKYDESQSQLAEFYAE